MSIEEYYTAQYPEGKPWAQLTKQEIRVIRRERRRENWENIKDTLEDIADVIEFIVMIFGRTK